MATRTAARPFRALLVLLLLVVACYHVLNMPHQLRRSICVAASSVFALRARVKMADGRDNSWVEHLWVAGPKGRRRYTHESLSPCFLDSTDSNPVHTIRAGRGARGGGGKRAAAKVEGAGFG